LPFFLFPPSDGQGGGGESKGKPLFLSLSHEGKGFEREEKEEALPPPLPPALRGGKKRGRGASDQHPAAVYQRKDIGKKGKKEKRGMSNARWPYFPWRTGEGGEKEGAGGKGKKCQRFPPR